LQISDFKAFSFGWLSLLRIVKSVIEYLTKGLLWALLTFETIADHKLSNSLRTQNLLFDP
ncbi:MAG TPA: hypothetical protein VLF09_14370, partial [Cellvibrio sp.]|nr:hypothetical protein [Cellvibrio sp.]